jgi:hypothetical protein
MMSGNQNQGSTPNYPEDSIQCSVEPDSWWIDDGKREFQVGRLVWAFLPHVDNDPYAIEAVRARSTEHREAIVRFHPLDVKAAVKYDHFPVAPLPQYSGEIKCVYRSKKRPAMIVHAGGPDIPNELRRNKPRRQTDPCILVAPFYGATEDGQRAGFSPAFVERVRRCEYKQFWWDILPETGYRTDSIMRLDQVQPVGRNHSVVDVTNYCLSETALILMEQFLKWFCYDRIAKDCELAYFKQEMSQLDYLY